jgi:hypothetical protein
MEISIEISYKHKDNVGIIEKKYSILPEQYFDLLDENESLDIDTLPKYDHAIEYLSNWEHGFDKKNISETKTVLREGMKTKIISEKFWNEGNNCLIECLELYPDNFSHLIIIVALINNQYSEVIRIFKETGVDTFDLTTHSILDVHTDEIISVSKAKLK